MTDFIPYSWSELPLIHDTRAIAFGLMSLARESAIPRTSRYFMSAIAIIRISQLPKSECRNDENPNIGGGRSGDGATLH